MPTASHQQQLTGVKKKSFFFTPYWWNTIRLSWSPLTRSTRGVHVTPMVVDLHVLCWTWETMDVGRRPRGLLSGPATLSLSLSTRPAEMIMRANLTGRALSAYRLASSQLVSPAASPIHGAAVRSSAPKPAECLHTERTLSF